MRPLYPWDILLDWVLCIQANNCLFVYDIADLYKVETTIPAAFSAVKETVRLTDDLGRAVRVQCRTAICECPLVIKDSQRYRLDFAGRRDRNAGQPYSGRKSLG